MMILLNLLVDCHLSEGADVGGLANGDCVQLAQVGQG